MIIVYCVLPIVHCPLPIVYCIRSIIMKCPSIVYAFCLLSTVYRLLSIVITLCLLPISPFVYRLSRLSSSTVTTHSLLSSGLTRVFSVLRNSSALWRNQLDAEQIEVPSSSARRCGDTPADTRHNRLPD